jgi:hypothetical protein
MTTEHATSIRAHVPVETPAQIKARMASRGGWGEVGGFSDHRYVVAVTDGRRRRGRCRQADDCPNHVSHYGADNGVVLMSGCRFHVAQWVRQR